MNAFDYKTGCKTSLNPLYTHELCSHALFTGNMFKFDVCLKYFCFDFNLLLTNMNLR